MGGGKGVEGEGRGVSTAPFQRGREGEGGVENLLTTFLTTYWQSKTIVTVLRGKNTLQNFSQYELKSLQPNMIYLFSFYVILGIFH